MEPVGRALRRWRRMRGLSLRTLAAQINYSHVYLWQVETGAKPALPDLVKACDHRLEANGELVSLAHREGDVNRRAFLAASLTAAAVPLLNPSEATAFVNDQLWKVYAATSAKEALLPLVNAHLSLIEDARVRMSLLQLAGEIHFDTNRYADARSCYADAAKIGQTTRNYDLWACALTRHAYVNLYDQQFTKALTATTEAEQIARRGDTQLTTAQWVQAVKAEAHAALGDHAGCERALALASDVAGKSHTGGWLRYDGSRLAEETGACYVQLGRPDQAEAALLQALAEPSSPRRQGMVLADLAMVGVLRKDSAHVAHYVARALDVARLTGSGVVARKLTNVQSRILEAL
jgi:transcriptional regulator with XRE-family HTH domain/Flp pilus assembly protein TadD